MLHRQLTAAFDCFYEAISLRVEHRTLKEQLQQKRDEANSLRAALSEMVFCAEFSQVKGILHTKDKEIAGMREQILKQTEQVEGLKLELKTLKNMHAKTVMFPRSEHLAS
jgi:predicted RNase H-like nuclease (RuvC/YqgF family)